MWKSFETKDKTDPALLTAFHALSGVFNQDQQVASRFVELLDPATTLTAPALEAIISILRGGTSSRDLRAVIHSISGLEVSKDDVLGDCKDVLAAL